MRRLCRMLGLALGVTEDEAAAAIAYTASKVTVSGVLLAAMLFAAGVVTWAASRESTVPGDDPEPTPVIDFRP